MRSIRPLGFLVGLSVLLIGAPATSRAGIIDFDGHPLDFEAVQFANGFQLTTNAQGWAIAPDDFPFDPPLVQTDTARYFANGDRNGLARVDVIPLDGLPFSLISLQAATMFADFSVGQIEVIGMLEGGGTVSALFDVTNVFETYILPDSFVGLIGFQVHDTFSGEFEAVPGFSLDNIRYNSAGIIPEPSSLAMVAVPALLGALAMRRRRSAVA